MTGTDPSRGAVPTKRDGIDVADPWAAIEACYAKGWTDGLPVVPPTDTLVDAMLAAGPWKPGEVLLHEPVRDRAVTAEKAAINAVMAGCRPEYFPVVGAALQAIGDDSFMLHGPATSTGGAALMVIVNGPIRERLGFNAKANLFGPGYRANATIGRTLRLILLNCLDCLPGVLDKSTQGWPGKYSGRQPAITALIAAFSAVTARSRTGSWSSTSPAFHGPAASIASTSVSVGGTTGRPSVQPFA